MSITHSEKANGEPITAVAPSGGVVFNTLVLIGDQHLMLPLASADEGGSFSAWDSGLLTGVPKTAGATWSAGQELYWDDSTGAFTTVRTASTTAQAIAAASALSGATTGDVYLLGPHAESDADIQDLIDDLAATTVGLGGDLVGLHDGGDVVTATTCGAAIIENREAIDTLEGVAATTTASDGAGYVMESAGADLSIRDSAILTSTLPTMPAVGVAGNLLQTAAGDREVSDAGIAVADVATMAAAGTAGNLVSTPGDDKKIADASIVAADVVTNSTGAAGAADCVIVSGGTDKSVKDSAVALTDLTTVADLADTDSAKGSKLVGHAAAGGAFTATDLQGAIGELQNMATASISASGGGDDATTGTVDVTLTLIDGDGNTVPVTALLTCWYSDDATGAIAAAAPDSATTASAGVLVDDDTAASGVFRVLTTSGVATVAANHSGADDSWYLFASLGGANSPASIQVSFSS